MAQNVSHLASGTKNTKTCILFQRIFSHFRQFRVSCPSSHISAGLIRNNGYEFKLADELNLKYWNINLFIKARKSNLSYIDSSPWSSKCARLYGQQAVRAPFYSCTGDELYGRQAVRAPSCVSDKLYERQSAAGRTWENWPFYRWIWHIIASPGFVCLDVPFFLWRKIWRKYQRIYTRFPNKIWAYLVFLKAKRKNQILT